jgi:hypothetical protein
MSFHFIVEVFATGIALTALRGRDKSRLSDGWLPRVVACVDPVSHPHENTSILNPVFVMNCQEARARL